MGVSRGAPISRTGFPEICWYLLPRFHAACCISWTRAPSEAAPHSRDLDFACVLHAGADDRAGREAGHLPLPPRHSRAAVPGEPPGQANRRGERAHGAARRSPENRLAANLLTWD